MKTTKEIIDGALERKHEDIFKDVFDDKSIFDEVWYSSEELQKARLNGIRDLRDMMQSDLNKLFKKYTQDFDDLQYNLMGNTEQMEREEK